MNELIPFDYKGNEIRTLEQDGQPWFVATDIARTLGYRSASDMTRSLDDDEKGYAEVRTPGGKQKMVIVTEAGLYQCIFGSRSRDVHAFKRWVTHEVLPTIRQRGGYINPGASEHQLNALIRQAQMRMELIQSARGIIDPKHLEVKARVVLAQGLGEAPQVPATDVPLYAADFLKSKNLTDKQRRSKAGLFGKALKKAYIELHGREPGVYLLNLSNGQTRPVCAYTEADRPLMERVWRELATKKVA